MHSFFLTVVNVSVGDFRIFGRLTRFLWTFSFRFYAYIPLTNCLLLWMRARSDIYIGCVVDSHVNTKRGFVLRHCETAQTALSRVLEGGFCAPNV